MGLEIISGGYEERNECILKQRLLVSYPKVSLVYRITFVRSWIIHLLDLGFVGGFTDGKGWVCVSDMYGIVKLHGNDGKVL